MLAMHVLHIPPNFITPRAMPQVDKHINPKIKQNSDFIWLVWASEINVGNSNNKVKASRPQCYVYLPSPKIKNVT